MQKNVLLLVQLLSEQVDWDCEVIKNYSNVNMGCKDRVSSGLAWAFHTVEEAIILEDDCLPHPTFFRFCQELLEKYRNDTRIMAISGNNFQFGRKRNDDSYYLSRYNHCWGWAAWSRTWQSYDIEMKLCPTIRANNSLKSILVDKGTLKYWQEHFDRTYDESINSWAYQEYMATMQLLKVLLQEPKAYLKRWLKCQFIQYNNPGLNINFPVCWFYDEIDAIKIGSQVSIGAFSEIVVQARSPYSNISGRLTIESFVVIGSHANIRAGGGEIYIGQNSILGQQVSLIASNHTVSQEKPYRDLPWDESKTGVFIDENVWIGAGVTILPGCSIGKNSIIGSGSVVTKNVPSNEIWVGVPAKKMREVIAEKKCECL